MAVHTSISTSDFGDKARRELLHLLEQVNLTWTDLSGNELMVD
jgi:hypothetical protein